MNGYDQRLGDEFAALVAGHADLKSGVRVVARGGRVARVALDLQRVRVNRLARRYHRVGFGHRPHGRELGEPLRLAADEALAAEVVPEVLQSPRVCPRLSSLWE